MFLLIKFWQKGYTMKKKNQPSTLTCTWCIATEAHARFAVATWNKREEINSKETLKLHISYILIFSISLLSKLTELF